MQHKIKIDENICLSVEIPDEISLNEFGVLTQTIDRMIRALVKQELKFGEQAAIITTPKNGRGYFSGKKTTKEERSKISEFWYANDISKEEKVEKLREMFDCLKNRSSKQIAAIAYNNRPAHVTTQKVGYTKDEKYFILNTWKDESKPTNIKLQLIRQGIPRLNDKDEKKIRCVVWRLENEKNKE